MDGGGTLAVCPRCGGRAPAPTLAEPLDLREFGCVSSPVGHLAFTAEALERQRDLTLYGFTVSDAAGNRIPPQAITAAA